MSRQAPEAEGKKEPSERRSAAFAEKKCCERSQRNEYPLRKNTEKKSMQIERGKRASMTERREKRGRKEKVWKREILEPKKLVPGKKKKKA